MLVVANLGGRALAGVRIHAPASVVDAGWPTRSLFGDGRIDGAIHADLASGDAATVYLLSLAPLEGYVFEVSPR